MKPLRVTIWGPMRSLKRYGPMNEANSCQQLPRKFSNLNLWWSWMMEKLDEAVNRNNPGEQVKVSTFHPTRPWNPSTPPSQTPACPCLSTNKQQLMDPSNLTAEFEAIMRASGKIKLYCIETPISVEQDWGEIQQNIISLQLRNHFGSAPSCAR